ncbi:MAG: hypothetical protein ABI759_17195 [Candidatus Solibacter sp.]
MKLPVTFQRYLEKFADKRLFVTSLDRRIAVVYPIVLWKQTKKFIESYSADPRAAKNLAFTAADLGEETEMDSQARVLFSVDLRRELNMELQPVHLYAFRGHINVFTQAVYEEDKRAATVDPVADLIKLEQAGMM